jgi:histidinol-phosphate phosphatase family protein
MKPMRGVARALGALKEKGFLLIVVTNQPPIEKGEVPLAQAKKFNEILYRNLKAEDALLDALYVCPHRHATGCMCKKPKLGLIEAAQKDFRIDMKGSWFVGDTTTDMETARRLRIPSIRVGTSARGRDTRYFAALGDHTMPTFSKITKYIKKVPKENV